MDDYEALSESLYQRVADEMEAYHNHLLGQSPEEILEHTFEYTTKADILMSLMDIEPEELSAGQLAALLELPSPLEDIYCEFRDVDRGLMDAIRECAGELAERRLAAQRQQNREPLRSIKERLAARPIRSGKPATKTAKTRLLADR
nr:DUF3848 domain-containing protein [uncultured Acetatifactor sp.]